MCQNHKELYLKMKDGEKETELRIPSFDEQNQLAIIQGVFNFFDVPVDFKEMAEVDIKTRQAYASFYNGRPTEFTEIGEDVALTKPTTEFSIKTEGTEETLIQEQDQIQEAYIIKEEEKHIEETEKIQEENDYIITGIKTIGGKKRYRCRYTCPKCDHRSNHYVLENEKTLYCYECKKKMVIKTATPEPFPTQDKFGNFFIAGNNKQTEPKEE
jgi:hypothetical protein